LISISLRIKYVAFSYRWPLVSFVSKPVAVRTTGAPSVWPGLVRKNSRFL
jgi:hypothetical protein